MVILLEQGANVHMAQLMPLPLTISCFSKIQIGFTFLVPAHAGSPGQRAVKRVCVCVCVCGYRVNKTVRFDAVCVRDLCILSLTTSQQMHRHWILDTSLPAPFHIYWTGQYTEWKLTVQMSNDSYTPSTDFATLYRRYYKANKPTASSQIRIFYDLNEGWKSGQLYSVPKSVGTTMPHRWHSSLPNVAEQ